MESMQGRLLIASPQLRDQNFRRSVVLVVQHDRQGAFGLLLNRPAPRATKYLRERLQEMEYSGDWQIHFGGPVVGPLMAIHTCPWLAEIEILPDLFFSAHEDNVADLVEQGEHPYKLFIGYAGWGPGQLFAECHKGVWHAIPTTADEALSERENLWEELSRQFGESMLRLVLHLKHVPENPLLN